MSERNWPESLQWIEPLGIGYFPCDEYLEVEGIKEVYGKEYYDKYSGYSKTKQGEDITAYRNRVIAPYLDQGDFILDFGCGSGQFVNSRANCYGYDINPATVDYLIDIRKYFFIAQPVPGNKRGICFWDSFEHIKDITSLWWLQRFEYAFMTIPIFTDKKSILTSKHFRLDEHYWYFTKNGLELIMSGYGFRPYKWDFVGETAYGRESVATVVFGR